MSVEKYNEVKMYADYLIEWIVNKHDIEFDRLTEFEIVRVIIDSLEMYRQESVEK